MSKRNYKFGGNVHETVPASRQNIEQRTPSGVRPVGSPVIPVAGVSGKMKNGGEVKNMKKPKKMAFGGPAGPAGKLSQQRGGTVTTMPPSPVAPGMAMPGRGTPFTTRGPGGQRPLPPGQMGPGGPPRGDSFGGGPGMYVGPGGRMPPGAGGMPMGLGLATMPGGGVDQGGYADFAAQRNAIRSPAMKKGGKVFASSYNDMTGGAGGGIGRLEKTSIASKTKSQKLKTGGKVKGYAGGKQVVADDDRSFGSVFADARRAKADEFEWRGKKYTTKLADGPTPKQVARKAMETPRNAGGGRRRSPDEDMVGPMDARPAAGTGGGRGGKRRPNSTPIDGGVPFPIEKRGSSSGQSPSVPGGPLPNPPPDWKSGRRKERSFLERMFKVPTPEERDAAYDKVNESGLFGSRMYYNTGRMGEGVKGFGPDVKKRGGVAKMAKGGKVEKFEGSAKDMEQDKKLAKKRGMSLKAWEKSSADEKHDTQRSMKGLKKGGKAEMHDKGCKCMACGGKAKYAMGGGVSTAQDGMKKPLRPKPTAMAKGGAVGKTFGKPLPGTKLSSQKIRATTATGASMKKDGMKGQLRAKASGAKPTNMMKPLGMTKMASGGKVRGAGIAQRGTKFIGEV